jgi:hypothetical protein
MTGYVWKHLPYAVYLDTNALRSAGSNLDAPWINELLSITNEYGISVCISELVLAEWCEHIIDVLKGNRQKLLSSIALLKRYGVSVPDVEAAQITSPRKGQLFELVSGMMDGAGLTVVPNWDAPLSQLIEEAVAKRPPFDQGGKGLCDTVIIESYALHAKENFTNGRVLVISNDDAVKRSGARFSDRGIAVDFVGNSEIVARLKSLLSDEVSAYIEAKRERLKAYILDREPEIIDFVRKSQLEITDWKLNPPFGEQRDLIYGSIESILSVRPIRITDVIGGAPTYGEEIPEDRYPVRISVEIELEIVVREPGFALNVLGPQTRVIVQPDTLDSKSPVSLEKIAYDWKSREIVKTVTRSFTVFATLDAEKEKNGVFDNLTIEKVF